MATSTRKKHWTENVHRNYRFEQELRMLCPIRVTNVQAYQIYAQYHAERPTHPVYDETVPEPPRVSYEPIEKDQWLQMNVRNQLCKLEHLKILERVEPGVYVWRDTIAKVRRSNEKRA